MNFKIIIICFLLLCSFYKTFSCSKKQEKHRLYIFTKEDCNGIVERPSLLLSKRSSYLILSDIVCLDEFNVFLYIESALYDSYARGCILFRLLNSSNRYLLENPIQLHNGNIKQTKMLVFLDALRKYTGSNFEYCRRPSPITLTPLKFSFDQDEIVGDAEQIYLFLQTKKLLTEKTSYEVYFSYSFE